MSISDQVFALLDRGITVAGEVQSARHKTADNGNTRPEKVVENTDTGQLSGRQTSQPIDMSQVWQHPAMLAAGALLVGVVALKVLR